eukprot:m51a1_g9657 hypothetical protein (397) ;mRNA; r:1198920-1203650
MLPNWQALAQMKKRPASNSSSPPPAKVYKAAKPQAAPARGINLGPHAPAWARTMATVLDMRIDQKFTTLDDRITALDERVTDLDQKMSEEFGALTERGLQDAVAKQFGDSFSQQYTVRNLYSLAALATVPDLQKAEYSSDKATRHESKMTNEEALVDAVEPHVGEFVAAVCESHRELLLALAKEPWQGTNLGRALRESTYWQQKAAQAEGKMTKKQKEVDTLAELALAEDLEAHLGGDESIARFCRAALVVLERDDALEKFDVASSSRGADEYGLERAKGLFGSMMEHVTTPESQRRILLGKCRGLGLPVASWLAFKAIPTAPGATRKTDGSRDGKKEAVRLDVGAIMRSGKLAHTGDQLVTGLAIISWAIQVIYRLSSSAVQCCGHIFYAARTEP